MERLVSATPLSTPGNWSTYTVTYTGLAADVGKTITIVLGASGVQGNFDNVRLDATAAAAVPEPVTWVLLGAGLIGLAGARRFRRA